MNISHSSECLGPNGHKKRLGKIGDYGWTRCNRPVHEAKGAAGSDRVLSLFAVGSWGQALAVRPSY